MSDRPATRGWAGQARALRILGLAVSAVSIAAVVWWASRQPAPEFPTGGGQIGALLGAIAVYGLGTALRAERWRGLLAAANGSSARIDDYGLTLVGFMGNNALPARAGDAMRVYLMAPRSNLRMRDVLGTLIAERVLDVLALLGLFTFLAYGLLRGIDTPGGSALGPVAVALIAAGALAALALFAARDTRLGRQVLGLLRPLGAATARLRGHHGLRMAALTLAVWATEAATYLLVGHSVGIALSAAEALYLIAVAGVFVLIPSGPGYAGTLDAAILFGLDAVGEGGSLALSYLIMVRFVLLVPITLAGAAVLVTRYGGIGAERAAIREARS